MNKSRRVDIFPGHNPLSNNSFPDEETTSLQIGISGGNATKKIANLGMLSKLRNLEKIYIYDIDFYHRESLNRSTIYLQTTSLRLPENIANLVNLKSIVVTHFCDVVIPKSIGELANLETLEIKYFSELTIPESVGNLKRLQKLHLEGKYFTSRIILPSQIGKLENLNTFYLKNVEIKRLPKSFTNQRNLKHIILTNLRSLKHLPDDIGRLQSLTTLDIDDSAVEEIPQSIVELRNLKQLRLSCGYITRMPPKEAIQTIQNEQVRNELMKCYEGLEERQQEERKHAVGAIEYFTRETVQPRIQRMSRKRITPKHVKKSLKFSEKKYGKKESNRMVNESFGDVVFEKFPREMEREKFRERRKKIWKLNRGLAEQLTKEENSQIPAFPNPYASSPEISPVESSATPELTPDDEEERREHWATIEANKQNYDLSKPWNSPAAEDAMDVVSNNTSPASAAASKRERSSSEPGDWTVGTNDNDNRPPKQSRKQAWKGGKRTKRRTRK